MILHQPSAWLLVLLVLVPLWWWWRTRRGRRRAVLLPDVGNAAAVRPSLAVRLRFLPPLLRGLGIAVLVVACARPQVPDEETQVFSEGLAIQLVIDRSGSMLALDFAGGPAGARATRLDAVKDVVERFVAGGEGLDGRPADLVGLVTFATWADAVTPLTLDHDHVVRAIRSTQVSPSEADRATAIGDAIALGVERLRALDERREEAGEDSVPGKVMILLTDGENNEGDIDPETAAEMAAAFDIKVHTIGAGSEDSIVRVPVRDPFTGREVLRPIRTSIDERTLRMIAERTGGRYFRATDRDSLRRIYSAIDELERTEIESLTYVDHREVATSGGPLGPVELPPLLLVAFGLLAADIILSTTRFRSPV